MTFTPLELCALAQQRNSGEAPHTRKEDTLIHSPIVKKSVLPVRLKTVEDGGAHLEKLSYSPCSLYEALFVTDSTVPSELQGAFDGNEGKLGSAFQGGRRV